jgi:hypothetical protein
VNAPTAELIVVSVIMPVAMVLKVPEFARNVLKLPVDPNTVPPTLRLLLTEPDMAVSELTASAVMDPCCALIDVAAMVVNDPVFPVRDPPTLKLPLTEPDMAVSDPATSELIDPCAAVIDVAASAAAVTIPPTTIPIVIEADCMLTEVADTPPPTLISPLTEP